MYKKKICNLNKIIIVYSKFEIYKVYQKKKELEQKFIICIIYHTLERQPRTPSPAPSSHWQDRQISKISVFKEHPPTKNPSIFGIAINNSALAGLTLPP